jgi:ferric-dicitrate binding protein FerR (iron transport regulator)
MMKESIEVRIGRYLAGEADASERSALEQELESNPDLQEQFQLLEKIWLHSRAEKALSWDIEKGWRDFLKHTNQEVTESRPNRARRLSWAVAAALLLALGAAIFLWLDQKPVEYAYLPGDASPLVLVDGTRVYLNENSSVKVHNFKRKTRKVELSGEAYFEVSSNINKPFIVEAAKSVTEVAGTSFNIDATLPEITIYVTSGKVIFRSSEKETSSIALASGEGAVLKGREVQRIVNPSPNMHAWHTKELSFQNMPLSTVVADVSAYFNQDITIENDAVKNCRVSIPRAFKEPEISSILEAVALSVNGELVIDGNKCIIRGGNCF